MGGGTISEEYYIHIISLCNGKNYNINVYKEILNNNYIDNVIQDEYPFLRVRIKSYDSTIDSEISNLTYVNSKHYTKNTESLSTFVIDNDGNYIFKLLFNALYIKFYANEMYDYGSIDHMKLFISGTHYLDPGGWDDTGAVVISRIAEYRWDE